MRHPAGLVSLLALAVAAGCSWDTTSPTRIGDVIVEGPSATLVGAGDIANCGSPGAEATARLLDHLPGIVFTAGDNAYPSGTARDYRDCYEPTWGRHKARTRPAPGNHEYESPGARPYFDYFGDSAGPSGVGYYTYRLGDWQVYALNSNVSMDPASPQTRWLLGELASSPARCSLAYWHHPLFSSGPHGNNEATRPLWRALYEAGVEIVLGGHDHLYERFAPQDPDGRPDPMRGIRQFIVGTGGAEVVAPARVKPNSDVRWSANGVLQLTLRSDDYAWSFLVETGAVADTGGGACH